MKQARNITLALLVTALLLVLLAACAGGSADQPMHVLLVDGGDEFGAQASIICYRPQGGAQFVCGSGGEFEVESGAVVDVKSGGTVDIEDGASLAIAGDGEIVYNSLAISMTDAITISGVLTNVQLLYYQN